MVKITSTVRLSSYPDVNELPLGQKKENLMDSNHDK